MNLYLVAGVSDAELEQVFSELFGVLSEGSLLLVLDADRLP